MCNIIQKKSINQDQYDNNNSIQKQSNEANKFSFENTISQKNIDIKNNITVKDVRNAQINPSTLQFNTNDSAKNSNLLTKPSKYYDINTEKKQRLDVSNNDERKNIIISQMKNLFDNYNGLFGRVLDDKNLEKLNGILKNCIENNVLPSNEDSNFLDKTIKTFKSSKKFIDDFWDKDKRKAFISSFKGIIQNINNINKGQELEQRFIQTSNKVNSRLDVLINAIDNSPNKSPLTDSLKDVMAKYKEALASGDKKLIALYSGLINKLTEQINKGASGAEIAETMKQYNNLVTRMYDDNVDSNQVNKELKDFLGEDLYKVFISDLTDVNSPPSQNNRQNNGNTTTNTNNSNKTNNDKKEDTRTESNDDVETNPIDILRQQARHEPSKPRPTIINTDNIEQIQRMTSDDINRVIESIPGFKENFQELQKENRELIESQIDLFKFTNDIKNNPLENNKEIKKDLIQDNIKEKVRKIIELALKMENELNLDVKSGETTIVTLLSKFRDIINKLDIDSKNNARKTIESILIDQKNQSYIRDMELRWKSIDKVKEQINKIFEEVKLKKIS